MYRFLRRSTWIAVLIAVLVVTVIILALGLVSVSVPSLREALDREPPSYLGAGVVAIVVLVALLASLVGGAYLRSRIARLMGPIDELTVAAERLQRGDSRVPELHSGIDELDRVGRALAEASDRMSTSLAAERDFASDASHQLRTPLTALLMRLEEIGMTDDLEVIREEAGIAIDQAERLTRVVDDLLMRRRRSNPDAPTPAVSLDSVIAALQREWQPAFEHARRSVLVDGERGLVVRSTPVALSQILSTLLENSLVHGRGTVRMSARRSGPSLVVEVSDEGDGVPGQIAPHIFERSVSSGRGDSSGLGLALARDLAESAGGRLDLVERVPATFALFLSEAETA